MRYQPPARKGLPSKLFDGEKEINIDEKARELGLCRTTLISRLGRWHTGYMTETACFQQNMTRVPPRKVAIVSRDIWMVKPAESLL